MLPLCPMYAMGLAHGGIFPWGFFLKVTHTRVPQGWSLVYKGEGLLKSSSCGVVFCALPKFGLGERLISCIANGSRRCQRWSGSFEWMRRDLRVSITVLFIRSARPFCSGCQDVCLVIQLFSSGITSQLVHWYMYGVIR